MIGLLENSASQYRAFIHNLVNRVVNVNKKMATEIENRWFEKRGLILTTFGECWIRQN